MTREGTSPLKGRTRSRDRLKLVQASWPKSRSDVLRRKLPVVTNFDDDLSVLGRAMIGIMKLSGGIGLAACQVGIELSVIVIDAAHLGVAFDVEPKGPIPVSLSGNGATGYVIVNPIIEKKGDDRVVTNEGCLSIPGRQFECDRAEEVRVTWQTLEGRQVTATLKDIGAVVFQHEVDHLKGILISDHGKLVEKVES